MIQSKKRDMKYRKNNFWEYFYSANGSSLAEFAVVGALMATLAATAAPKLAVMIENTKKDKSLDEIDKILNQAKNFYEETAKTEGRGRFPGQEKYNMPVGDYGYELDTDATYEDFENMFHELAGDGAYGMNLYDHWIVMALNYFTSFDNTTHAPKWRSVFGVALEDADPDDYIHGLYPPNPNAIIVNDQYNACSNCTEQDPGYGIAGHNEWRKLFNQKFLTSPYQDGHYIYIVQPGYGTGVNVVPPVLYVADLENPAKIHKILQP
jgi:hypothetical protein